jgi:hypothetical protein
MITEEMIHGRLPRSDGFRRPERRRSPLPVPQPQGLGEWDASARLWNEIQTRRKEAGEVYRPPCRTRIEDDTPLHPRAAAELVCEETSLWLAEPFPPEWAGELAERANVVYQHNARFRQLLRRHGDAGRDWLIAFMRHWLYALLDSRRPDLCHRLPRSYAVGRELPPPPPN